MNTDGEFEEADLWLRAKALFEAGLSMAPSRRQEFLDDACRKDLPLRSLLELLLVRHDQASSLFPDTARFLPDPSPPAVQLAPGDTLAGRFRILHLAGEGGMGQVYKALDLSLDSPVAIKVIRPHLLAATSIRQRFRVEVRRSREVTHRHVCRVHELFEGEPDQLFLTMEYLEGVTLAQRLVDDPPWIRAHAFAILGQMCQAIADIHAAKIVHLDLKPANIFLTRPFESGTLRVVITDFGLSALLEQDESSRLRAVALGGTPGYMAPEQIFCGQVGPAADLYALAMIASELGEGQPRCWQDAVRRCLEVDPGKRFASVGEFWDHLSGAKQRRVRLARRKILVGTFSGAVALAGGAYLKNRLDGPKLKIAVLAFDSEGGPAVDHIALGLTDSTIQLLSSDRQIFVPRLASVLKFRGLAVPPADLCKQLGVDALLSITMRKRENAWIFSLRSVLSTAAQGPLSGLFEFREANLGQVPAEIAKRIQQAFLPEARLNPNAVRDRSPSPEATDAYYRGRYLWARRDPGDVEKAIQHFEAALSIDPAYAMAHCGVADALAALADAGVYDPRQCGARAREAAGIALRLAPEISHVHASAGLVAAIFDYDLATGLRELQTALQLNPGNASAHQWLSAVKLKLGDTDGCLAAIDEALAADPLNVRMELTAAGMRYLTRRYVEALDRFTAIARTNPSLWVAHDICAECLARLGRHDEARREADRALQYSTNRSHATMYAAVTAALCGDLVRARFLIAQAEQLIVRGRYFQPFHLARAYAELGDEARAFAYLDESLAVRDAFFPILKVHHSIDSLRKNPRYDRLLKRAAIQYPS